MASLQRNPVRTREKILHHATREFASCGFDGARVDKIALRCKLSKNMLYYYFKSKEGLFVAVLERMYETLRSEQRDVSVRENDPKLALEQLIYRTFFALSKNPDAIRLMNEENRHKGRHIRKSSRIRTLYDPLVETLRKILERGVEEGIFRPGLDPVAIYLCLSSLCYHYLSNQYTLEFALGVDLRSELARAQWLAHTNAVIMAYCLKTVQTEMIEHLRYSPAAAQ